MRGVRSLWLIFLLTLLFSPLSVYADDWVKLNSTAYGHDLNSVYPIDQHLVFAVGSAIDMNSGIIIRTENGGNTWSTVKEHDMPIFSVCGWNENDVVAVGSYDATDDATPNSGIHVSHDSGETWSQPYSPVDATLWHVSCVGDGVAYATGYGTWNSARTGFEVAIIKTTDYGDSWGRLVSGVDTQLFGGDFVDEDTGYLVGGGGDVLKTTTGSSFDNLGPLESSSGIGLGLSNIHCLTRDECWLVGVIGNIWDGNFVYKTENGGINWSQYRTGLAVSGMRGVHAVDEERIWISGQQQIRHTEDGGESWETDGTDISSPPYHLIPVNMIKSIKFVTEPRLLGWAVGDVHNTIGGVSGLRSSPGLILRYGQPDPAEPEIDEPVEGIPPDVPGTTAECPLVTDDCEAGYVAVFEFDDNECAVSYECAREDGGDAPSCEEEYEDCLRDVYTSVGECSQSASTQDCLNLYQDEIDACDDNHDACTGDTLGGDVTIGGSVTGEVPDMPTCEDSDGGEDIYTTGILNVYTPIWGRTTVSEYCVNQSGSRLPQSDYVEELVCLVGDPTYAYVHRRIRCPAEYVCDGGRCVTSGSAGLQDGDEQEQDGLPSQESEGSGEEQQVTPDSFLWNLDRFFEGVELFLTRDKAKKAEKRLQFAQERLLEAKIMIKQNKLDAASKAKDEHGKVLENIQQDIQEIKKGDAGEEVEKIIEIEKKLDSHTADIKKDVVKLKIKAKFDMKIKEKQVFFEDLAKGFEGSAKIAKKNIVAQKEDIKAKLDEKTREKIKEIEKKKGTHTESEIIRLIDTSEKELMALQDKFSANSEATSAVQLYELAKKRLSEAKKALDQDDYGRAFGLVTSAKKLFGNAFKKLDSEVRMIKKVPDKRALDAEKTRKIGVQDTIKRKQTAVEKPQTPQDIYKNVPTSVEKPKQPTVETTVPEKSVTPVEKEVIKQPTTVEKTPEPVYAPEKTTSTTPITTKNETTTSTSKETSTTTTTTTKTTIIKK